MDSGVASRVEGRPATGSSRRRKAPRRDRGGPIPSRIADPVTPRRTVRSLDRSRLRVSPLRRPLALRPAGHGSAPARRELPAPEGWGSRSSRQRRLQSTSSAPCRAGWTLVSVAGWARPPPPSLSPPRRRLRDRREHRRLRDRGRRESPPGPGGALPPAARRDSTVSVSAAACPAREPPSPRASPVTPRDPDPAGRCQPGPRRAGPGRSHLPPPRHPRRSPRNRRPG